MLDFFSTAYKAYQIVNNYKDALRAAQISYEAGNSIDQIVEDFVRNTDGELDDNLVASLKKYLNDMAMYAETGSKYCWESVVFVEENLPKIAESLQYIAARADEHVPPAVKKIKSAAEKLDNSTDDITENLSKLGTNLIKFNLRLNNLRHGKRK